MSLTPIEFKDLTPIEFEDMEEFVASPLGLEYSDSFGQIIEAWVDFEGLIWFRTSNDQSDGPTVHLSDDARRKLIAWLQAVDE